MGRTFRGNERKKRTKDFLKFKSQRRKRTVNDGDTNGEETSSYSSGRYDKVARRRLPIGQNNPEDDELEI